MNSMIGYAIGLFATKGLALMMLPVMANHLSSRELGELELYATIATFFALLIGIALHEALYRFVAGIESQSKRHKLASQLATINQSVAVGWVVLLLTITQLLGWNSPALTLVFIGLAIDAPLAIHLTWLRMQERVKAFVLCCVLTALLQASLVMIALINQWGVTGVLAASVVAHFIQYLVLQMLNRFRWQLPLMSSAQEFFGYTSPLMGASLLAFGLNGAERWLIASTTSLEVLGQFAIAAKFALAMCILVQPFGMWWMPKRFTALKQQGVSAVARTTQIGVVWIVLLTLAIAGSGQLFILHFLPSEYHPATDLLVICLAMAMSKEISELTNIGILANKQTTILLKINLVAMIGGLGLATLLSPLGIEAILLSLLTAQLGRTLAITTFSQRICLIPYAKWSILGLIGVAYLGLIAFYLADSSAQLITVAFAALSMVIGLSTAMNLLPMTFSAHLTKRLSTSKRALGRGV
ncbi:oligosaccharide flippase family protein [Vibrio sp. SCSIO 43136]|uniref:lipopolysaccharide biosynthesis protein n=1 Tax=Vibrio sp. SCSIO 43136 TaxID=2819101 RepID=UPI002075E220|nr:oligosaccharide flippase family protein [Vibrio sp. SCSIO 43136]USD67794.1 oligosaccharide flippase family protein [Vibrio sp. SCSIO 43136]